MNFLNKDHFHLIQKASDYLLRYCTDWKPPVIEYGLGTKVTDVEGKEYLDFTSGQMCATVGHNHPRVIEAIKGISQRVLHLNSTLLSPETIELGERIAALLPTPLTKSIFLSTGSESTEVALKLAKHCTGCFEIVAFDKSFHGLTSGASACTYSVARRGRGPSLPGFAIPAPYCYRCPVDSAFPGCEFLCLRIGLDLIDAQSVGSLAAIFAEPIVSAGGLIAPPEGYFPALKAACQERGMLFLLDEAQTAFGRLGAMFGFEQDGAQPDILALSKTLGGGIPISGTVTTPEIEEKALANGFFHMTSHASDPLPSAVALAILDIIQEENLVEAAQQKGSYFKNELHNLAERYEIIGDIRGRGLLVGIEFVRNRETKESAEEEGARITVECLKRGLIVNIVQFPGSQSVWRIAPPLTVSMEELDQGLGIIEDSIKTIYQ